MRGVKARLAMRRARVWTGGSVLVRVGTERKPWAMMAAASAERGWMGDSAFAAE